MSSDWPPGAPSQPLDLRVYQNLVVDGTANASRFLATSDARAKQNIRPLSKAEAVERLARLRPVIYDFVGHDGKTTPTPTVGFVAQDVQQVCPEAVFVDAKGHYSLDQTQLIALLVRATQPE